MLFAVQIDRLVCKKASGGTLELFKCIKVKPSRFNSVKKYKSHRLCDSPDVQRLLWAVLEPLLSPCGEMKVTTKLKGTNWSATCTQRNTNNLTISHVYTVTKYIFIMIMISMQILHSNCLQLHLNTFKHIE